MIEDSALWAGSVSWPLTVPPGLEMSGYGFYLNRKATRGDDRLRIQCLCLWQDGVQVAILTADLLALSTELTVAIRTAVSTATSIPFDNILIACSHTHAAPTVLFVRGCGEVDPNFTAQLPKSFATAALLTRRHPFPVATFSGQFALNGLARNRVDAEGAVDTLVQTLAFTNVLDNEYRGIQDLFFALSCHPVIFGRDNTKLSADFPGFARQILEKQQNVGMAQFLQGSCGDVNPVLAHGGQEELKEAGRIAGEGALAALAQSKLVDNLRPLRCRRRIVELPLAIPTREALEKKRDNHRADLAEHGPDSEEGRRARMFVEATESLLQRMEEHERAGSSVPTTLPCELQAIQVGDIVFLAHPTELFAEFGIEIRSRSPFPHTFVVGYANGFLGYIPNEAEFARGGYAADTVPYMLDLFPFAPNVGRVFTEACVQLLEDLYADHSPA